MLGRPDVGDEVYLDEQVGVQKGGHYRGPGPLIVGKVLKMDLSGLLPVLGPDQIRVVFGHIVPGRARGPQDRFQVSVDLAGLGGKIPLAHHLAVLVPGHDARGVEDVPHLDGMGVAFGLVKVRRNDMHSVHVRLLFL